MDTLNALGFWVPPLIVAGAALFVFVRSQVMRTTERQLSDLYAPLYLYVRRGLPTEGEFWKQLSAPEAQNLIDKLHTENYLATTQLLQLIESEIVPIMPTPFTNNQKLCILFQRQVVKDYKDLRERYLNWKRWLFPKLDP